MLLLVTSFSALGGFLYGYDLGLIGGALLVIREEFHLSLGVEEAVVGSAKFGAFFATFLGGALMKLYGRRVTIAANSVLFVVGPLIMAFAGGAAALIVGRAVVGMGIGVSAVVVPAYLGEVAPAGVRGRIVMLYEVMLAFGMLAAIFADTALQHVPNNWRWMVGLPCIPGLLIAAAFFVLPESPRWLVVQGKLDAALAAMHRVYTNNRLPQGQQTSTAEVEGELLELWSNVEKERAAAQERLGQGRLRRRQVGKPSHTGARWVDLEEGTHFAADSLVSPPPLMGQPEKALPLQEFKMVELSQGSADAQRRTSSHLSRASSQGREEHTTSHLSRASSRGREELTTAHLSRTSSRGREDPATSHLSRTSSRGREEITPGREPPAAEVGRGEGGAPPGEGHNQEAEEGHYHEVEEEEASMRTPLVGEGHCSSEDHGAWMEEEALQRGRFSPIRIDGCPGGSGGPPDPVADELADPSSPLHRALSRVPSNLAPIRTQPLPEEASSSTPGTSGLGLPPHMLPPVPGAGVGTGLHTQRVGLAPASKCERLWREICRFGQTFTDMLLDIYLVSVGPERRAMRIALALAFFNQAIASSAIVNYAPRLLSSIGGASHTTATLLTAGITVSKMIGVMMSVVLVDTVGRRPLLVGGSIGCCLSMFLVAGGDALRSPLLLLLGMAAFMLAFSCSHAGVFWVVCSEIFSMSAKSPALSAATAMLFLIGALTNSLFLTLYQQLGWGSFIVFASIAAAAALFCLQQLPETKERTLLEVQALLATPQPGTAHQRDPTQALVEPPPLRDRTQSTRSALLHSEGDETNGVAAPRAGEGIRQAGLLQKLPMWSGYSRD